MTLGYYNIDDFPEDQIYSALSCLPPAIAEEIDKYKLLDDKKARLISRLMLQKIILDLKINWNWDDWKRTLNNKPYNETGPFFNISHSGKIVMVAVSETLEVGVDIEEMKNVEVEELSNYFHPDEISYLKMNTYSQDIFYWIWTRKESLLKAIGIGFLEGLNKICVLNDVIQHSKDWYFKEIISPQKGYKCSLCSSAPIKNINKIDFLTLNKYINEKTFF